MKIGMLQLKRTFGVARTAWLALFLGATLTCAGLLSAAVLFSLRILTPPATPDSKVRVHRVEHSDTSPTGLAVWLSGAESDLEGKFSFLFGFTDRASQRTSGHAKLGPVIRTEFVGDLQLFVRDVLSCERGTIQVGASGRITGWWYADAAELQIPFKQISLPLDDGYADTWVFRPKNAHPSRWSVHIHGRAALAEETFRGVIPLAAAGINSLVIQYRNDPGAPAGNRGRYGLGLAEWRDIDSALQWLHRQGAASVTLVGWSMGGTTAVLAADRATHRSMINGLVLDTPALDWRSILRTQAKRAGMPALTAKIAIKIMQRGYIRGAVPWQRGTDINALTAESLAKALHVPTLIHAGPDDSFVPWVGAQRVAQLRPELVTLREARGEHVKIWNVDPQGWEKTTESFVRSLYEK